MWAKMWALARLALLPEELHERVLVRGAAARHHAQARERFDLLVPGHCAENWALQRSVALAGLEDVALLRHRLVNRG